VDNKEKTEPGQEDEEKVDKDDIRQQEVADSMQSTMNENVTDQPEQPPKKKRREDEKKKLCQATS